MIIKLNQTSELLEGPTLYKLDSMGKLRTWRMQLNHLGHYRTLAGLADGKQAVSGWTVPVPASQSTVAEQGEFEVRAAYKHQLDREYHESKDTVDTPKMIEPMLAKTYDKWPGPGYAQPKLDGIRCIATKDGLFSRQGQPIVAVPHIQEQLTQLFAMYPSAILDGELYNHDFREDFGAISSIVRKKKPDEAQLIKARELMQYWVYDSVDPKSSFSIRQDFLSRALTLAPSIIFVPTSACSTAEEADTAYGNAVAAGFEGGIYRLDARYELGRRSKHLLKRKEFITEEFPLVKIEPGVGNWAGAAKRFTLRMPDGREFGAGTRGSYALNAERLKLNLTDKSEATVRYFQLTPDGIPRFGVVIDIHPDGRKD
jgi:DNA ligase-1